MTEILPEATSLAATPAREYYNGLQYCDFRMRPVEKLAKRLMREIGLGDIEDQVVETAVRPHIDNADSFASAEALCAFPIYELGPKLELANHSCRPQDDFLKRYYLDSHNSATWLVSSLYRARLRRDENDYVASMDEFTQKQRDFFLQGVREQQFDSVPYVVSPRSTFNYANVRLEVARNAELVSEDEADALASTFRDRYEEAYQKGGQWFDH